MIKSDIIKIKCANDNSEIETELRHRGIIPLRWAVVEVSEKELSISVSYEINSINS